MKKRVKIGLNLGKLGEFGQKRGKNVSILRKLFPQAEFFPTGRGVRIFEFYLPVHFWLWGEIILKPLVNKTQKFAPPLPPPRWEKITLGRSSPKIDTF